MSALGKVAVVRVVVAGAAGRLAPACISANLIRSSSSRFFLASAQPMRAQARVARTGVMCCVARGRSAAASTRRIAINIANLMPRRTRRVGVERTCWRRACMCMLCMLHVACYMLHVHVHVHEHVHVHVRVHVACACACACACNSPKGTQGGRSRLPLIANALVPHPTSCKHSPPVL